MTLLFDWGIYSLEAILCLYGEHLVIIYSREIRRCVRLVLRCHAPFLGQLFLTLSRPL